MCFLHSPGEVLAARCGPLYHVGEADAITLRQALVMHVVKLLISQTRKKQTFPWMEKKNLISQGLSKQPKYISKHLTQTGLSD